jgi:hypothetical protein
MPTVQCPCGATYDVPAELLGQLLTCQACNDLFMAEAVEAAAASPGKKRIGELAVERGLVSREHLDLCVEYQAALRKTSRQPDKRLGEVLVEKGLLKPAQVESLVAEQSGEAPARRAAGAKPLVRPAAPPPPRGRAEPPAAEAPQREPATPHWSRYLVLVPFVVLGVATVMLFWPPPAARRTLATYLESCREGSRQVDQFLAVRDLRITVRDFRIEGLAPSIRHDYTPEIRVFTAGHDQGDWAELIRTVEMLPEKRRALTLLLPILPATLTLHQIEGLTITVQPIACYLFARLDGSPFFTKERYRFLVLRAQSPKWEIGWKVAAYEPLDIAPTQ